MIEAYLGAERVSLLEVDDLEAGYGPVTVLRGDLLQRRRGQIVAVLGPNGAGKTTTLRALSGMVRRAGTIRFDGKDVSGYSPEKIARRRDRPRARGPRHVHRADRRGEPARRARTRAATSAEIARAT